MIGDRIKSKFKYDFLNPLLIAITVGVISSLGSIPLLLWLFGLSHERYVTLLPKSITTAIGTGALEELGGIFNYHRCCHCNNRYNR